MRVAFLTPEFITEYRTGGGLGNYLGRITELLVNSGHAVEVFVLSENQPKTIQHGEVIVHRVSENCLVSIL